MLSYQSGDFGQSGPSAITSEPRSNSLPDILPQTMPDWNWHTALPSLSSSNLPTPTMMPGASAPLPWPLLQSSDNISSSFTLEQVDAMMTDESRPGTGHLSVNSLPLAMSPLDFTATRTLLDGFSSSLSGVTGIDHQDLQATMSLPIEHLSMNPAQVVFPPPSLPPTAMSLQHAPLYSTAAIASPPDDASQAIRDVLTTAQTFDREAILGEKDVSDSARAYLWVSFYTRADGQIRSLLCPATDTRRVRAIQRGSVPESTPWAGRKATRSVLALCNGQSCARRPLKSQYTVAATSSYVPAVRALAESLHLIACEKLEEAVRREDHLLDAINAAKMLGKWLFSRARALEAYKLSWLSGS